MDIVEYYENRFRTDLLRVAGEKSSRSGGDISIVSFVPGPRSRAPVDARVSFGGLKDKVHFLFGFYFSALFDQAIHSSLRQEHDHFDAIARYPKFRGFLGTYHANLHPSFLLLIATLYTEGNEEEQLTQDLRRLSAYISNDWCHFLSVEYPRRTNRLRSEVDRDLAVRNVFSAMSTATAYIFQPVSLKPYSRAEPQIELFRSWVAVVSREVNESLDAIESAD